MDKELIFSVIIPVKNGDKWLEDLFNQLTKQTLIEKTEIIVIDSGSKDRSLDIIKNYPVRLIQIDEGSFNHGETRNLGAREARGRYVIMTVQDAIPVSERWLEYFLEGFTSQEAVAGVCGQQVVPHEKDKNPILWFRPISKPNIVYYQFDKPEDFLKLSPQEKRQKAGWDNVVAAYDREVLLRNPFPRIDFSEDLCWAREMLVKGYKLCYNDHIKVYHYHHHLPEFVLPRYFSVYYFEYKLFKLRPQKIKIISRPILSYVKTLVSEKALSWSEKIKWVIFNFEFLRALKSTSDKFNSALEKGEDFLDAQYSMVCKQPPQAPKY